MPGSSRIHGVSNLVSIADVVSDDLIGLIRGDPLNPRFVLPFLHEAAHHACFTSAVGSAIAHLQLELWREVMEEEALDASRVANHGARVAYARELLRPLQEGVACFREFDTWTRSTSWSIGVELVWTLVLAGQPKQVADPVQDRLTLLRDTLWHVRLSDGGIDRKANLILQPLESKGGGHLPGYIFLKSAWLVIAACVPMLVDETDLFCSYARTFFFGDHVLAHLIVDDADGDLDEWTKRLLVYLNERVNTFVETDAAQIAAFDAWSASVARPQNPPAELLRVDPEAQRRGIEHFDAIDGRLKAELKTAGIRSFLAHLSASRHLFRIGAVAVRLDTLSDGRVSLIETLDGEEVEFMRLGTADTAPPSDPSVDGLAEIIFDTHSNGLPTLALVVSAEREVVAIRPLRGSATPEDALAEVAAKHVDRGMIEGLEQIVIDRLASIDDFDAYLSEVGETACRASDLLYLATAAAAFGSRQPEAWSHPDDLLRRFEGVNGVRAWALFGVAASAAEIPEMVAAIFKHQSMDYQQVLNLARPETSHSRVLGSIIIVDEERGRLQALP